MYPYDVIIFYLKMTRINSATNMTKINKI